MKLIIHALVVVTLSKLAYAGSKQLDVLFRHSCDGSYEFIPNLPVGFGLNLGILERSMKGVGDVIWERASCQCPDLTKNDFLLHFDPVAFALNAMEDKPHTLSPTSNCSFPLSLTQLTDLVDFKPFNDNPAFKKSCNVTRWLTEGSCGLSAPIASLGISLELSIKKCSNAMWGIPAMELECTGPGCKTLGIPCSSDAQCANPMNPNPQTCMTIMSGEQQKNSLQGFMTMLFGYSARNCYTAPGKDLITAAFTYVRSWFDSETVTSVGFCGIPQIMNEVMSGNMMTQFSSGQSKEFVQENCLMNGAPVNTFGFSGLNSSFSAHNVEQPVFPLDVKHKGVIAEFTCDGIMGINEGLFTGGVAPGFMDLATRVAIYLYNIANCALRTKLTQEQFLVRFGLWSPSYWLFKFDSNVNPAEYDLGAPGYDWTNLIPGDIKIKLPNSCTYQTWASKGKCTIAYDGLSSLLGLDTAFVLSANRCPTSSNHKSVHSSYTVRCDGADCPLVVGTSKFCNGNQDCGKGICYDLEGVMKGLLMPMMQVPFDSEFDPVAKYLLPPYSPTVNNVCSVYFGSSNNGVDSQCGGEAKFIKNLNTLLKSMGVKDAADGAGDGAKVCAPNTEVIMKNTDIWARSQMAISYVVTVTIPYMRSWMGY